MSPARILVVAGSSGGHIFPALAFLEAVKEKYPGVVTLLLLPEKIRRLTDIDACAYNVKYIAISSVNFSFNLRGLKELVGFLRGIGQSLFVLSTFRPNIVVGFGSIASVPAIIFGWLFREKTLIHEQNVIPGRATKILAGIADRIAISFGATQEHLKRHKDRIVVTGNPLRKAMMRINKQEALDYFGFRSDKLTILVMGGSQGSRRLNEGFLSALSLLRDKSELQVIHLAGRLDYGALAQQYRSLGVKFALFDFLKLMHCAYSASDIALSRSGATTIAELTYFRLPAILVPYPYAYEHQYENAKILGEAGCAVIIKDEDLNAVSLKERLEPLFSDRPCLDRMRSAYGSFRAQDAAELLVKEAMSFN